MVPQKWWPSAFLFTTTWVAYEALSLIKSRMGYKKTLELWEVLNNQRLVKLVRVSRIMEEAGLKIFFEITRIRPGE
ncbi:hypothetical protein [Neomoorella thermoacetica]|uniref:hypothetical protein n=1 Tax=Neomoorella thermoacetica TaxID=1525 RepID=UPI0030D41E29